MTASNPSPSKRPTPPSPTPSHGRLRSGHCRCAPARRRRRRPASAGSRCRSWCRNRPRSTLSSAPPSEAGATELKPAKKSLWGYGGVVRPRTARSGRSRRRRRRTAARPPGRSTSSSSSWESPTSPRASGSTSSAASKWPRATAASTSSSPTRRAHQLALYGRRALAKTAGVAPDGTGSHRIAINSTAGTFTDPDGFTWEAA